MKLSPSIRERFVPMSETMFYILLALMSERHGYGIMKFVAALTDGRIQLSSGTIYQSLRKLENGGLIRLCSEEGLRKTYVASDAGKVLMHEEAIRIGELYRNSCRILLENEPGDTPI